RDAYFIRRTAKWFRRRLAVVQPDHVFVADYGPREQALCLASRELGIPTIELQHGVIDDVHPAYANWTVVPDNGYETRPTAFWCWDRAATGAIERPGAGTARAILGGDPWREEWLRDDSAVVRTFDKDIQAAKAATGLQTHVLVTLDPIGPAVPDVLLDAMRRA